MTEPLADLDGEWSEIDPDGSHPSESQVFTLFPELSERNERLDKFVASRIPAISRGWSQRLIESGNVLVDGRLRSQTFKITPGEVVEVTLPPVEADELQAENIPLIVLYEDEDIIVINKPAGMVVHPAPGHRSGTLVNALLHYAPDVAMAGSQRPGIVHRLDRDTSGLIVVARTDAGRLTLLDQWARRSVTKEYLAIIRGVPEEREFSIDAPIARDPRQRNRMAIVGNGKAAQSHVVVQESGAMASLAAITIATGRTHQIRVHLAYAGFPVVGDRVYNRFSGAAGGESPVADRQMLHAAHLVFNNVAGDEIDLQAPMPPDMIATWSQLGGADPPE